MKLSKKGATKIVNNLLHLRKIEFEDDDFEGGCFQNGNDHINQSVKKVELSVEEASLAMECAQLAYMFASSYRRPEAEADKELANKLAELIAKAEGE